MGRILLAITPEPSMPVVVITGLVLVFLILVLLSVIIMAEGRLFDRMAESKKKKPESSAPAAAAQSNAAAPTAPAVEDGIPAEVVAAIAAAVSCMDGGKYVLRRVARAGQASFRDRGAWGRAGAAADTQPF